MELPNYFFADLPREAQLSATMVTESCQHLKRNRERFLAPRTTGLMIGLISSVAKEWLDPEFPLRKLALERGGGPGGFPRATMAAGLEAFFRGLTPENLEALVEQDLGDRRRLDQFTVSAVERQTGRSSVAVAPGLMVHFTAGNLPVPALMTIVLGLLVRSAQFVKCATDGALVPRLFAHSIYQADAKLGACLEVAEWPGGDKELEGALFAEAELVTATGTNETLSAIQQRLPATARFVGYGQRVSFAYVGSEMLAGTGARQVAARAAADVAAWNQCGCLSPHLVYIQDGGMISAELFGKLLAEELARMEEGNPRGELTAAESAAIASRRGIYELRAAHSPETQYWASPGSTAWTVVYEADPRFQLSCLNRFVYVKTVKDLGEALRQADTMRGKVSTVALAVGRPVEQDLAAELARWGVTRICPLGRMQQPSPLWRHDGRPALGDLVTWADWEQE